MLQSENKLLVKNSQSDKSAIQIEKLKYEKLEKAFAASIERMMNNNERDDP